MEDEDYNGEAIIDFGDGLEVLINRDNTTLFTFLGDLATRNHVFIITEEEGDDGLTQGHFIFAHNSTYELLKSIIEQHNFPMILNRDEVPESDEMVFQQSLDQFGDGSTVEDYFPDDWTDGGN